jgi:membrane protein YfhO
MPTPTPWRREIALPRRSDIVAVAGLAALAVLLFKDVVLGGRVLYERDIHSVWHGQVESLVRCVASGAWPTWDPYLSFGQPFLANPGTQVLYPWTWLNLLLPPDLTYTVYAVGHLLFAGSGLYLLARRLELSRTAAFVGAAIWMACGPLLSTVSLWHHFAGAAWMPWVLLAADAAFRAPSVGRSLLWGAAFAAQILAGSADMCAMTGLITACHALPFLRGRDRPALLRFVGSCTVAITFALCLSAALWMPAVENARRSGRWEMSESSRTFWSVHPLTLLQAFLPLLPGDVPLNMATRTALFDRPDPFLGSLYVGLPAFALAAASFTAPRPPWVFGIVTLAASVLALGRHTWAYSMAVHLLPPLKILRFPSKAMVPAAFAGALLCAYGFEAWGREAARSRPWRLMVVVPVLVGTVLVWSTTYLALHPEGWGAGVLESPGAGHSPEESLGPAARKLFVAGLLSTAAAVLALMRLWKPAHAHVGAVVVAGIAVAGLLWADRDLNPTAPADFYRARPPILDVLRKDGASRLYVFDYGRVTGKSYGNKVPYDIFRPGASASVEAAYAVQSYLFPPTGSRWGFFGSYESDIYSLHSAQLRSLTLVLRAAEETPLHDRLLRIGSVDHVVALDQEGLEGLQPVATLRGAFAAPILVFRVPAALPRTYAVSGARIADGLQAYRTLADPSFDPSREVILAEGHEERAAARAGATRILELRHDRVRIAADLERPGYVVLVDTYDPGWKATVDGQGAPVLRANTAFRAVPVAAGRHLVEMVYRPLSVIVGAALSAAAALVGLGTAAAHFMKS